MPDVYLIGASVGVTLTTVAVVAEFVAARRAREQHGREIEELKARVAELEPVARRDRLTRRNVDVGESFLFNLVTMAEDEQVLRARIEYAIRLAEHVRDGGKPDDLK